MPLLIANESGQIPLTLQHWIALIEYYYKVDCDTLSDERIIRYIQGLKFLADAGVVSGVEPASAETILADRRVGLTPQQIAQLLG